MLITNSIFCHLILYDIHALVNYSNGDHRGQSGHCGDIFFLELKEVRPVLNMLRPNFLSALESAHKNTSGPEMVAYPRLTSTSMYNMYNYFEDQCGRQSLK